MRIVLLRAAAPTARRSTDELVAEIRRRIRQGARRATSRRVIAVADLPRTRSNKLVELAVRDVVHGRPVRNTEALANPEALDQFRDLEELRSELAEGAEEGADVLDEQLGLLHRRRSDRRAASPSSDAGRCARRPRPAARGRRRSGNTAIPVGASTSGVRSWTGIIVAPRNISAYSRALVWNVWVNQ